MSQRIILDTTDPDSDYVEFEGEEIRMSYNGQIIVFSDRMALQKILPSLSQIVTMQAQAQLQAIQANQLKIAQERAAQPRHPQSNASST